MKTLVTGTDSGFGAYLKRELKPDFCVTRDNFVPNVSHEFDMIIHCAADPRHTFPTKQLEAYWYSNFGLLVDLMQLRSKYFVFISSADVTPYAEKIGADIAPYAFMKLVQETTVRSMRHFQPSLILRPTALVGPTMRANTTYDIVTGKARAFSLARSSRMNYVHYADLLALILECERLSVNDTLNVASTESVRLERLARNYDYDFGSHLYVAPVMDCEKAYKLVPSLRKTSIEVIDQFRRELEPVKSVSDPNIVFSREQAIPGVLPKEP